MRFLRFFKSTAFIVFLTVMFCLANSLVLAQDDVIGKITMPESIAKGYGDAFGDSGKGGLIAFASNLIKLIMVVAGLWSFINVILAGFTYITSFSKPEKLTQAQAQIYNSLIGLAIIVASFALAGLAGWILFHDASAILSPKIYGPGI